MIEESPYQGSRHTCRYELSTASSMQHRDWRNIHSGSKWDLISSKVEWSFFPWTQSDNRHLSVTDQDNVINVFFKF